MFKQDLNKILDALVTHALSVATEINTVPLSSGAQKQRQLQLCNALTHIERLSRLSQDRAVRSPGQAHSLPIPAAVALQDPPLTALASAPGDDELTRLLALARYPHGYNCACGTVAAILFERRAWRCPSCGRQSAIAAGTALQDSHLPWSTWFRAVEILSHKPGISAQALADLIGLKRVATARRLMRKILALDVKRPLKAPIEIANALVGNNT